MKNTLFLISFFLVHALGVAQKVTQQTIGTHGIQEIHINTDKVFQLNVYSTNNKTITIETKMEGEYYHDVNVVTATKNKQLHIECAFAEGFELPNDKLSAHKVFSITMNIFIPKQLDVQIHGDETQVYVEGNFHKFWAALISGNYIIKNFFAEAKIQTKKGNIHYIKRQMPVFETCTTHQLTFYEKGKKVEMTANNGKITYSSHKG
ncbi:hypothetical protein [Kordia zhangzhouensis]|uniref:hypothetical protein n=1 Tax=Kordia zhangzhouensis TaxID=1620405 RepID=UPI000629529A|nr:hypothetical protein [Kordia zhangzhouensis]